MEYGSTLGTVSLGPLDISNLKPGDTATIAQALKQISPTSEQLALLLGTPGIASDRLSLSHGYEPYIQLVPTLLKSDDPSYLSLVAELLGRRGLPAIPSPFNAGAVASGTTPIDAICGRGQRYFVYSVSNENYTHPVSFSTRIQTRASGQLYDCTNMTVIPVGVDQHSSVLTTKSPLASLIAIVSAAFVSKSNSWAGTLQVGSLVSGFVDSSPDSIAVRDSVSDRALQGLVDNLCIALAKQPTPAPVISPPPIVVRVASPARPNGTGRRKGNRKTYTLTNPVSAAPVQKAGVGVGTALVSLDVSGFLARAPAPLVCHDPHLDMKNTAKSATDTRWKLLR
jgi:hypothetical protein